VSCRKQAAGDASFSKYAAGCQLKEVSFRKYAAGSRI
jgi:hypothetical protein